MAKNIIADGRLPPGGMPEVSRQVVLADLRPPRTPKHALPCSQSGFLNAGFIPLPRRTVSGWAAFIYPPKHKPLGVSSVAFVDIEAHVADWIDSAAAAGKLSNPAS